MNVITNQLGEIVALEVHGTRYSPAQLLIAARVGERMTPVVQAALCWRKADKAWNEALSDLSIDVETDNIDALDTEIREAEGHLAGAVDAYLQEGQSDA